MSKIQEELRYTKEHEWARAEGGEWVVGITDYAQGELGDVVYVELPQVGLTLTAGQSFGTVEAVKTVSDLYAPMAGTVTAVNGALKDDPSLVNREPYAGGWMIRIKPAAAGDTAGLLDSGTYANLIGQSE